MYVHEFLDRTTRRNLNLQIDCKVQQRMKLYAQDLENRRLQLACLLHCEEQQLDLELEELLQERADAEQNKRIESIQRAIMRNNEKEQELIAYTRFQREIENSEDYRHRETKEILLDSKQAQLHQIEERREQRRLAAYMDKQWQLK